MRRGVHQRCNPAPPVASGLFDLHRDARQHLVALAPPTANTRISTADEGLIYLNRAGKSFAPRADKHRPETMEHGPHGLVGADLESPLQAQRSDPVLAGGEEPAGGEPHGQGRTCPVEDRSCGYRSAGTTTGALEPSVRQSPATDLEACRANEPGRPTQPLEIVQAVGIGPEPSLELPERLRVVLARAGVIHVGSLHDRSG